MCYILHFIYVLATDFIYDAAESALYAFQSLCPCTQLVSVGWGRGRAAAPGGTLQGAAFEGRKFVILVFTLQCVRVSLYLFFIYSVH